ncbi:hypothetical protein A3841_04310 [Pontibacter flavimaris]|uniref:Uncharacterized protein n=1 Tax=Pontibacter flavimaris TaxID=1797110 RepID=A0A1Q5PAK5_9BACT|nr:hypothetical protein A3841_04310 [Pontibacter flavimaris]
MLSIARNQFYEIAYSAEKNRLYFRIDGYWKSPEVVPSYISDWKKALELTKPSFTLLADFRNMVTHPSSVKFLHQEVAEGLAKSGISNLAEVSPSDKIAVLQTGSVTKDAKISHIKVTDIVLGEHILDRLS